MHALTDLERRLIETSKRNVWIISSRVKRLKENGERYEWQHNLVTKQYLLNKILTHNHKDFHEILEWEVHEFQLPGKLFTTKF